MGYLKDKHGIEIAPLAQGSGVCRTCGRSHLQERGIDPDKVTEAMMTTLTVEAG